MFKILFVETVCHCKFYLFWLLLENSKAFETFPSVSVLNNSTSRNRNIEPLENSVTDHDYFLVPDASCLNTCSQSIVACISGIVVFKLGNLLHCEMCISALNISSKDEQYALINLKAKGALVFPSEDVLNICILCEKKFRINIEHNSNQ